MKRLLTWLEQDRFRAYSLSFLLMVLPCFPLYFSAQAGSWWSWPLLGLVVLGNLLALLIR
jgi:hypothetical protein